VAAGANSGSFPFPFDGLRVRVRMTISISIYPGENELGSGRLFDLPDAVLPERGVHRVRSKVGPAAHVTAPYSTPASAKRTGLASVAKTPALGEWMRACISTVPLVPSKKRTWRQKLLRARTSATSSGWSQTMGGITAGVRSARVGL